MFHNFDADSLTVVIYFVFPVDGMTNWSIAGHGFQVLNVALTMMNYTKRLW